MKLALKLPKKTNNIIFGNDSFEIVNIFNENNIAYKNKTFLQPKLFLIYNKYRLIKVLKLQKREEKINLFYL